MVAGLLRAKTPARAPTQRYVLNDSDALGFAITLKDKEALSRNYSNSSPMIYLPNEYGSLPPEYSTLIPPDYGHPEPGKEGKPDIHSVFDPRYEDGHDLTVSGQLPNHADADAVTSITPVMAAMIDHIMKPFRQLNFSTTEFAALQAIMFFDPDAHGLDAASQRDIAEEQNRLIRALHRHILKKYPSDDGNQRFANILLRIPTIRKVAAKKNETLQMICMLKLSPVDSLIRETLGICPDLKTAPSTAPTVPFSQTRIG